MSAEANEAQMSKCLRTVLRTNSDVVCELAFERREVASNLDKLKKVIDINPTTVSEHHKDLWKRQAKAMKEYVDVLSERIKDLLDSDA